MKKLLILTILIVMLSLQVYAGNGNAPALLTVNASAIHNPPIITYSDNAPIISDRQQDILFSIRAYDLNNDSMNSYCQLYRNSVAYGSIINTSIANNITTNVCNASVAIKSVNEHWFAEIYVSNGFNSSSIVTTSSSSSGVFLNNLAYSNFINLTFNLNFTTILPTNYTIDYSLDGNPSNLNNSISSTSLSLNHNITLPINPPNLFYYNISTYTSLGSKEINGTFSTNYSCTEHWVCTSFGTCNGTDQVRSCTDLNTCATTVNKPAETTACTISSGGGNIYINEVTPKEPNVSMEYVVRPLTCGNGVADYGETYFNCPSDIKADNLDLIEKSSCVLAGVAVCPDADKYSSEVLATWGVSLGGLFLILRFGVLV